MLKTTLPHRLHRKPWSEFQNFSEEIDSPDFLQFEPTKLRIFIWGTFGMLTPNLRSKALKSCEEQKLLAWEQFATLTYPKIGLWTMFFHGKRCWQCREIQLLICNMQLLEFTAFSGKLNLSQMKIISRNTLPLQIQKKNWLVNSFFSRVQSSKR